MSEKRNANDIILKDLKDKLKNKNIKLPGLIVFFENDKYITMQFTKEKSIGLGEGKLNMQDSNAAFEGWAVSIYAHYAKERGKNIKLDISSEIDIKRGNFEKNGHYARFLYRILRFSEQYSWFILSDRLEEEKNKFKEYIENPKNLLTNNYPGEEGSEIDIDEGDENAELSEHKVELIMTGEGKEKKELCICLGINPENIIYNQLPVGLFKGNVSKKTAFFTRGKSAIDMWAIVDNTFYMMELKFNNKMVGIVTEAFFYINFVRDLLSENAVFTLNETNRDYGRGYAEFVAHKRKIEKFRAITLSNEMHPLINDAVLSVLRENTTSDEPIEYEIIKYGSDIGVSFDSK